MKTRASVFAKGNLKKTATSADSNPYLTARRTWNDHVGSILTAKQMWQAIALMSLLIAMAAVGGMIYIGQQSKFVPYIIEVNKLGEPVVYGSAQRAAQPDQRVIRAQVADFISSARLVTPDAVLQRRAVFRVYAMLAANEPAMEEMNEWYKKPPFKRAATETVEVDIRSVMPQTDKTWQVDWTETTRDRNSGVVQRRENWRALVTVYHIHVTSKTSEQQLTENPIGTYVRAFSWSKQI